MAVLHVSIFQCSVTAKASFLEMHCSIHNFRLSAQRARFISDMRARTFTTDVRTSDGPSDPCVDHVSSHT